MNRSLTITASVLALLLIFWAGLVIHFPGKTLSRLIAGHLNRIPNIEAQLSPASLGLLGIKIEEFKLDMAIAGQLQPVLVLKKRSYSFFLVPV